MSVDTDTGTARIDAPLSFGQRRIWMLDRISAGGPAYNIAHLVRLHGPLDAAALGRALDALVSRHETLRTVIVDGAAGPELRTPPPTRLDLPLSDLSATAEPGREAELERLAATEAHRGFDLERDLMLRARLYRLDPRDHGLLLVLHHIAADGWSMAVLYRELGILYAAETGGSPPVLPVLPIQYTDFAAWQHERLRGELLGDELAWWRRRLSGAPDRLDLPADRPRPPVSSGRGAMVRVHLPTELTVAVRDLAARHKATPFMVLLAGFKAVLHRFTGANDLLVGSFFSGRTRPETAGLVGFFVNTMVLRTELAPDLVFTTLLERVRDSVLGASEHQELPFEKLVEDLHPGREPGRGALCQVVFSMQNIPSEPPRLAGIAATVAPVFTGTAKFDLSVWVEEDTSGFVVFAEYASDLFDGPTVRRMLGNFQTLLAGALASPGERIGRLPLLTPAERHCLLYEWNDTTAEYDRDHLVHEVIAGHARAEPGAAALVFENRVVTRGELDARATRIASRLRAAGVGPDALVGLCVERSPSLVAGLLGILKAGCAYVPLDPSFPAQRIAFMIEDSRAPVLLTELKLRASLPPTSATVICVDEPDRDIAAIPPESGAGAPGLAYVIYTSGSTGQPKGVMVRHAGVLNFLAGMDRLLGRTPGVWLAVTSISFDIAVLELLWTLARGWKVVLMPDQIRALPDGGEGNSLASQVERHGVSHLQCTPSHARLLLQAPDARHALRRLRRLLLGGEPLPAPLARELAGCTDAELINLYGPTETTVWSSVHHVRPVPSGTGIVSLGRPIANTQIYIVDRNLELVPAGVPGELVIGGDGLAAGYLRRPALTAEKFVTAPFRQGARVYRTGDLARWRGDGTLEFLCRADHQVKLRGYRIELGEIEAVLAEHPSVGSCVAVLREDAPGDPRLAAYLVSTGPGEPPAPAALREFLRRRLPEPMVPSDFVVLERLPLTPNGKVDRQALPAPEATPDRHATRPPPETELERTITATWRRRLGTSRIGRHDNFFDLGGHSLLILQVHADLCARLSRSFPVVALFQYPTVSSLAAFLGDHSPVSAAARVRERVSRQRAALGRNMEVAP